MKKRNLLITTAIAGLMVFSISTAAMANPDLSKGEAKSNQFWWLSRQIENVRFLTN